MTLDQAPRNRWFCIDSIDGAQENFKSRLLTYGLVPGEKVLVKQMAPIFKDPILIQLDSTQLILTKNEAKFIQLEKD